MSRAAREAERRRRARTRKAATATPATPLPPRWWQVEAALVDCPDPANHKACPKGGEHDWRKPNPRPADHKYECAACGHYDLDDYR